MPHKIRSYTELERQIHKDLRTQHPEWIQPNGKCAECDEHELRLRELLEALGQTESKTEAGQQVLVKDQSVNPSSP